MRFDISTIILCTYVGVSAASQIRGGSGRKLVNVCIHSRCLVVAYTETLHLITSTELLFQYKDLQRVSGPMQAGNMDVCEGNCADDRDCKVRHHIFYHFLYIIGYLLITYNSTPASFSISPGQSPLLPQVGFEFQRIGSVLRGRRI